MCTVCKLLTQTIRGWIYIYVHQSLAQYDRIVKAIYITKTSVSDQFIIYYPRKHPKPLQEHTIRAGASLPTIITMQLQSMFSLLILSFSLAMAHPSPDINTLVESDPDTNPAANATTSNALMKRADCEDGECVTYYKDQGCTSSLALGSYKPDCSGHCFQYDSFGSLSVKGNDGGILFSYKTKCTAYRDDNCQDKISETSDVGTKERCLENIEPAKSMKCYWHC